MRFTMKKLNIAFGVITCNLLELTPFINFLINAQKYGHCISTILLVYRNFVDQEIVKKLSNYCEVQTIELGKITSLQNQLKGFRLNNKEIQSLIGTPFLKKYNRVSYGTCRNYALLTAILKGTDILIFFDTDVYPQILYEECKAQFHYEEIDFVGSHLDVLCKNPKVVATTSDYTGYFIIPQMNFPHLADLFLTFCDSRIIDTESRT